MIVIGAGFGRTGTLSLKAALEELGLGPCYHMLTAFERPEDSRRWQAAYDGGAVDWDGLFEGFQATVDWPACDFWQELTSKYPDARVLLTVRDSERWYESFRETLAPLWSAENSPAADERLREYLELVRRLGRETFGGRIDDKRHVISVFEEHNRAVREAVPEDRLLVYDVREGWKPLCDFLDVPVPREAEFPHLNDRAAFQAMVRSRLGG